MSGLTATFISLLTSLAGKVHHVYETPKARSNVDSPPIESTLNSALFAAKEVRFLVKSDHTHISKSGHLELYTNPSQRGDGTVATTSNECESESESESDDSEGNADRVEGIIKKRDGGDGNEKEIDIETDSFDDSFSAFAGLRQRHEPGNGKVIQKKGGGGRVELPNRSYMAKVQKKIDKLMEEIEVMRGLCHPNIVRYCGTECSPTHITIFMEYVVGGSIAELIRKFGKFNETLIRVYTKEMLQGLDYLHCHRIIHRDIKGANILVDKSGSCKLADFGASRRLADLTGSSVKSLRGTPYWMAPEVIKQTQIGRQADIWSVGCTIIEMADAPPFSQYVVYECGIVFSCGLVVFPN